MNPDESEMNSGTSILFTGLESQMENTDSVNELRSCSVISPCLFIVGSKDGLETKQPCWGCVDSYCKTCNYRLANQKRWFPRLVNTEKGFPLIYTYFFYWTAVTVDTRIKQVLQFCRFAHKLTQSAEITKKRDLQELFWTLCIFKQSSQSLPAVNENKSRKLKSRSLNTGTVSWKVFFLIRYLARKLFSYSYNCSNNLNTANKLKFELIGTGKSRKYQKFPLAGCVLKIWLICTRVVFSMQRMLYDSDSTLQLQTNDLDVDTKYMYSCISKGSCMKRGIVYFYSYKFEI